MKALRIIFGTVLALVALFIGGCSLFFGVAFLGDPAGAYGAEVIPIAGLLVFPFLALVAWLLLRGPVTDPAEPRLSPGRILGGVVLGMIALYAVGDMILFGLFSAEIGAQVDMTVRAPIALGIAVAAAWGAWRVLRSSG